MGTPIYNDFAEGAGAIARRLLAEQGLIYLDDLGPDEVRDLLGTLWRQAAEERFAGLDVTELHGEIDAMVDSLIMSSPFLASPDLLVH